MPRPLLRVETLGMTLDVGHGELLSEKNTAYDFLAQYPEKIYHMHVHDNQGGSTQADDLHLLPGQGVLISSPFLRRLDVRATTEP